MKEKKEALGKGIRALLESMEVSVEKEPALLSTTFMVPLEMIEVNPFQPRVDFDPDSLHELAESIKVHGIIQPVTVRRSSGKKYQLISGERRLKASLLAGLTEVPAYVRTANDQEMLEMALIENTHREDLNAVEVAINYKRLTDECNLTAEQLAERVGKNRTTVVNYLRLLKLPPDIQNAIKQKEISMAHARAIINVDDPVMQLYIFKEIKKKELSVRDVELLARQTAVKAGKKRKPHSAELPFAYRRLQENMASHLSTRVTIRRNKSGNGEIVISFFGDSDLDRISELIER